MDSTIRRPQTSGQALQIVVGAFCVVLTVLWLTWFTWKRGSAAQKLRLPPGPRGWPFLGALPYLSGRRHEALHTLSLKYGPIMFMHLGSLPTLVVSNSDMAKEVFKTNDRIMASRPNFAINTCLFYDGKDVGFAPYGSHWREVRKICTLELFTATRINQFQNKRRDEIHRMVKSILIESQKGHTVKMDQIFGDLTMNVVTQMMWNKSHRHYQANASAEGGDSEFDDLFREISELMGENNIGDFIPSLNWLSMNLQGLRNRVVIAHQKLDKFIENIVNEHRQQKLSSTVAEETSSDADDFIDVLLNLSRQSDADQQLSEESMKAILTDMLLAGTDTSAQTLEWALAELLKNPAIMKRAQDELSSVVGSDRLVNEADVPNLPYLHAILKEALRLHPPAPLALPHSSIADCLIGGFHVPAGSLVFVNLWGIQRDPTMWETPLKFDPERFLGAHESAGEIDWKGQDFHLIPFGSGRRVCPAMNLASSVLHLTLAQVLHTVDWGLPDNQKPEDLDMEEVISFHSKKAESLCASAKPRLSHEVIFSALA